MSRPKPDIQQIRENYPITKSTVYVNHAAVGPQSLSVAAAMAELTTLRLTELEKVWETVHARYDEGRRLAAKLVNGNPDRIAYIDNTSHGVALIANGLAWKPGDNVVVPSLEFPSNYLAWLRLAEQGLEVRTVDTVDGRLLPDSIAALVDERTRLVTLSHVQFFNGFVCDLAAIGAICAEAGAMFMVDGTQSIGAINADMVADNIDILLVSAHKWMLGPLGIGFMALSERAFAEIGVNFVGWLSVNDPFEFRRELDLLPTGQRFEPGTENASGRFGLVTRLREIDAFGAANMQQRIITLTDYLCEQLAEQGCQITSPRRAGEKSGIVTFVHPKTSSERLLGQLTEANIAVSLRNGAIRVSPHYYNTIEEMGLIAQTIGEAS